MTTLSTEPAVVIKISLHVIYCHTKRWNKIWISSEAEVYAGKLYIIEIFQTIFMMKVSDWFVEKNWLTIAGNVCSTESKN